MLTESGKSGNPCLIPDLRGNAFSFSPLSTMLAVVLLYMAFIVLRYVPWVAQMVNNLLYEVTWVRSLVWKIPWRKE